MPCLEYACNLKAYRSPSSEITGLRVSGDPTSRIRGQASVGIALDMRVERALLEWIPVNSRFCVVRSVGSVHVNES